MGGRVGSGKGGRYFCTEIKRGMMHCCVCGGFFCSLKSILSNLNANGFCLTKSLLFRGWKNSTQSSYQYNAWDLIIKRFLLGSQSIKWRIAERGLDRDGIK